MKEVLRKVFRGLDEPARTQFVKMLVGLKTYWEDAPKETGGSTHSARYCYSVWLRHASLLARAGALLPLGSVVELGPGPSLGTGLAMLLSGSSRYHAFDVVRGATPAVNQAVFEDLVPLFRQQAPIPDEFSSLRPFVDSLDFPTTVFDPDSLAHALRPARLHAIRNLIAMDGGAYPPEGLEIAYLAPSTDLRVLPAESADLIITHSVLEYVQDLPAMLSSFVDLLRPGGWMSHQIDFSALQTAAIWNGHWSYSDWAWRIICGKRPVNLNRLTLSSYVQAIEAAGARLFDVQPVRDDSGLKREQLDPRFASLSHEDLQTRSAHIIARKPLPRSAGSA